MKNKKKQIELFFDIDGCLVDKDYNINVNEKKLEQIILKNKKTINFNLNSNRSLRSILSIRDLFGFNGKIVYENGVGIYDPLTNTKKIGMYQILNKIDLKNFLKHNNYDVIFNDTDKVMNDINSLKQLINYEIETIFCEESREYTMTCYPRTIKKDKITKGNLNSLSKLLLKNYPNYDIILNKKYDNLIIIPTGANKGTSLNLIAKNSTIASFGDELADIFMFEKSQIIGCPNNAEDQVKQYVYNNNGFVSDKNYTAAALDFIKYINNTGEFR